MRHSALLSLLLFFPGEANAAQFERFHCKTLEAKAVCQIELQGEVGADDRLYLSHVHDRDTVSFQGREIGSTGTFLGRTFHAGFFPRVYSLALLQGRSSPVLTLEATGGLTHNPGIPKSAKVKIIDSHYPIWKILGPSLLHFFSFAVLLHLTFYLMIWLRQRTTDGWIYPREELRCFLGALSAYLLLRHEVAEIFVPLVWSPRNHLFAQRIAVLVALWSLTLLLLAGRFSDRSCIERGRARGQQNKSFTRFADLSLILSLALLVFFPKMSEREATSLLALPLIPLVHAFGMAVRNLEWQRVLKRSSKSPLLFHLSLILLPIGALVAQTRAVRGGSGDQFFLEAFGWAVILLSGLRMRSFMVGKERSRQLAADCRFLLLQQSHGSARLQALCNFVAEEWGAARISVISVDREDGLVLASAGPDAIPMENRACSRRLGPFLRRVCKQGQMLYAPVAEELGKDLQSEGLKHSSLAIPLSQEHKVSAVVCMMADEGERIPPNDAAQLEILVETLSLEILSAVAQHVSENRNQHLLGIARRADALAVESLDHWGQVHPSKDSETRVVLGGDCVPVGPFLDQLRKSPTFGKVWAAYRAELRSLWTSIATAYEFIPKDNRDDFWVISPREFRHPLLQELGAERVAILLSSALEKQARSLSAKECYLSLGYCGVRLVGGRVSLRQSTWHGSAIEIDSDDFSLLLQIRGLALPGTVLFHGNVVALSAEKSKLFQCRPRPWTELENKQIFSILSAGTDKKEMKRMENQALEKVRGLSRKAA